VANLGLHQVVQFVEALARRRAYVCREVIADDRHDALEKALSLLPRVPDVEDPAYAVVVIEPRGVDDQAVDRVVAEVP
jgi:hypothetical protein